MLKTLVITDEEFDLAQDFWRGRTETERETLILRKNGGGPLSWAKLNVLPLKLVDTIVLEIRQLGYVNP